jgi:phosphatidylglycerophosphate synthase
MVDALGVLGTAKSHAWFAPRPLVVSAARHLATMAACVALASLLVSFVADLSWRAVIVALSIYFAMASMVLANLHRHQGQLSFGSANTLTLTRAATVAVFFGILIDAAPTHSSNTVLQWILTISGTAALAVDGVDGWVARRTGMATDFGARFDMEADALFMLALALLVYSSHAAGPWVLCSGLLRYLFVVAGFLWAPLAAPLSPSSRRKTICVVQMAILISALAPTMTPELAWPLCVGGLSLLGYSFGVDCLWLAMRASRTQVKTGNL